MVRLIDGDALIEKFNEKVDMTECLIDARTAERFATFCALADAVEEMPTADVAPVRHGHWISLTECANEGVYCSICKKKVWKSDYAWCSKRRGSKLQSNYCPNCGAKMDGELNE